ncbi:hypothetical protein [Salmonella enterica]|uniref:hypothetical protein n=1 Tax=Salmonella enterica TaxID=28901 RepID=UPI003F4DD124
MDAYDADDEAAAAVLAVSADAALADASPAFVVAVPALLSADAADEAADQIPLKTSLSGLVFLCLQLKS